MIAYEGQRMVMTDEKDILTVVSNKSGKGPPQSAADRDDADSSDSPRREHRSQGEPRNEDRPRGDSNRRGGRGPRSGPPRSEGSGDSREMPNPDRPS